MAGEEGERLAVLVSGVTGVTSLITRYPHHTPEGVRNRCLQNIREKDVLKGGNY